MAWWNPRNSAERRVGIEILPDGLAIACTADSASNTVVDTVSLLPCAADQRLAVLADFVQDHGLQKASCNLALSPGEYQLLLVEAPQVPDEELRAAVQWRLKDLVNVPLSKAAVDLFTLPSDATRGGKRMLFVVVTELDKVNQRLDFISDTGLSPSVIDINELALRNLSLLLPAEQVEGRGVVLVRLREGGGSLGLYRDGNLYLSRQFELNYGGGLLDDLPETDLTLEIQRSVDYSERQMGQAPPAAIYICGDNVSADKITDSIKSGLAAPVQLLQLQDLPRVKCPEDEAILQSCAGAIGAALRHEGWS